MKNSPLRLALFALALAAGRAAADLGCVSDIRDAGPDGSFCHGHANPQPAQAQLPSQTASQLSNMATGAVGGAIGGAIGNALTAPLSNTYQGHVRPKPVVGDDDESASNASVDAGMGTANDVLKGYNEAAADGAVRIFGETPQLLRAAERPPLVSGNAADIEDLNLPPEAQETPPDLGAVSLEMLKGWSSGAKDEAKEIIAKTADLEEKISDMKIAGTSVGDAQAAAGAANDYATLLNNNSANPEELASKLEATGKPLEIAGDGILATRVADICANRTIDACQGAAAGGGLALVSNKLPMGGLVLSAGSGLGSDGMRNIKAGNDVNYRACMDLQSGGCSGFQTSPIQQKFGETAQGFFDATK